MPPPLSSFSGLLTAAAKPFVKTLGPVSSSVIRQQQQQSYTTDKPVVTESAILNSFPRPNLQPTLQSSSNMYSLQMLKTMGALQVTCVNCSGPHSTEYCPC